MKNKSRKKERCCSQDQSFESTHFHSRIDKRSYRNYSDRSDRICYKKRIFDSKEGEVTTISQSSIEKILDISELSTLEYTYNAVAAGYDEDGKTLLYHVAYEGTVSAGIDFDKLKVKVNPDKKEIRITVPEAKILDCSVNEGSLKYIFEKDEYNTATISADAYKVSKEDLKKKANEETRITELAKENAISAISGLIEPWVDQVDDEYTVIIK